MARRKDSVEDPLLIRSGTYLAASEIVPTSIAILSTDLGPAHPIDTPPEGWEVDADPCRRFLETIF